MYNNNKYQFPLFLFLILEKSNINFWTSKVNSPNHFYCMIDKNWIYLVNQLLRKEFFLNSSMLIENSAIDCNYLSKNNVFLNFNGLLSNNLIVYYMYYILNLKLRLTFLFLPSSNQNLSSINSIDKIFKNANWVERETSEMYNINYLWKNDTRKILIDYSKNEYPLLKNYPSEGFQDVFYNFFENQVAVNRNEVVEL
jgi:NADH:ubiquinone oxidoreductase subunit C